MDTEKKEAEKKKAPTNQEILDAIAGVAEQLSGLNERVSKLEEKSVVAATPQGVAVAVGNDVKIHEAGSGTPPAPDVSKDYPVPLEYRNIVDTILNRAFEIRIVPKNDAPAYEFWIIVPEKYRSVSPAYIEMYKEEGHMKVLNYADGVNGVRAWTEKVFGSFNSSIQALIVADRSQLA